MDNYSYFDYNLKNTNELDVVVKHFLREVLNLDHNSMEIKE